jgi:1,4-dihydroxy-6-naphthoate synthase
MRLRLGISPCPNDTFAFHGLLSGRVAAPGLDLAIELHDVEEHNRRFARGALDAAKCSFHAGLHLAGSGVVLPAGSALGFGVGPVLLARPGNTGTETVERVLCPGEWTTAHLLYRLFHPGEASTTRRGAGALVATLPAAISPSAIAIQGPAGPTPE